MSEKQMTGKDLVKRVAPVAIAFVLVVLIAIIVMSVKGCSNRTPKVTDADKVYLKLDDLEITNDRLYTYMKQSYGVAELIRLVDKQLYADEYATLLTQKSTSLDELTELDKFTMTSVFGKELTSDDKPSVKKANEKKWEELVDSLLMNNLLKQNEVTENDKDPYKLDTKVWQVVRENYALQLARRNLAKKAYEEKLKADREKDDKEGLFDESELKDYFEDNYSDEVIALFIPFTSEEAAKKTMNAFGINTNSTLLGMNGWIKSTFDYNSSDTIPEDQYLTSTEVYDKFIEMYNLVYGYLGQEITSDDYTEITNLSLTLSNAEIALKNAIDGIADVEGNVVLPLEVKVNGLDENTKLYVTWKVTEGTALTLAEDGKTLVYTKPNGDSAVKVKIEASLGYETNTEDNNTPTKKATYTLDVKPMDTPADSVNAELGEVNVFKTYEFDVKKLSEKENPVKLSWNTAELTKVNSTLAGILKGDATNYYFDNNDATKFYKSYTIKPQKCGDYYVLAVKFAVKTTYNSYEDVKDEIIDKLLEEAITDNAIEQMIYKKRQDAGLQIYDRYLEAIYDYQYTNFHETTLKLTDYDKYKDSKKNEKEVVAKFKVDGKYVTITADELFKELKQKYAVSTTVDLINQYRVINSKYNTIYNFYTNQKYDEKTFKQLLETEIGGFRKNFELDYFTYSYLSYYGFTPNFPAKYGWNNFKKDYFGAYTDEELLVNANFGGTVYSTALQKLNKSLYTTAGDKDEAENAIAWENTDLYKAMKKAYDEWYGLSVVNLMVYVDNNYDSSVDTQTDKNVTNEQTGEYVFETSEWTDEQRSLVNELIELVFELAPSTAQNGIYNQLNELVTNYKDAGFETPLGEPSSTDTIYTYNYWAKFKKAGLMLKVESAQNYNNTSSLVEEFLDELEKMYNTLTTELNLEGTLEVPYVSPNNVETTYGYHKIIALGITEKTELPEEIDVRIHDLLDEISNNSNSTIDFKVKQKEEAEKELTEILKGLDIEYTSDYKMDEKADAKIKAWYDNAVTELSGNKVASKLLIDYIKQIKNDIKTDDTNYFTILDIIINVSEKDLQEE